MCIKYNFCFVELASRLSDAKMETDRVKDLKDRVSVALLDVKSDLPYGKSRNMYYSEGL